MGIYQSVCYKVEDLFVKLLSRKQDSEIVNEKVSQYRVEKEMKLQQRKAARKKRTGESVVDSNR